MAQDGIPPDGDGMPRPPAPQLSNYRPAYPEESQAVLALVLSVVGLAVCGGLLCPIGWYLANREIAAIDSGRRDPSKRDTAQAGKVVGIIGTALVALAIVALAGIAFLALAIGISTN